MQITETVLPFYIYTNYFREMQNFYITGMFVFCMFYIETLVPSLKFNFN